MKGFFGIFWIAVIALMLVACGGAAPQLEPVTINMSMTEYLFEPSSIELKAGQQVTFELVNDGQLQHEIMFGREVMMENNRPAGYNVDLFQTANVEPQVSQSAQPEEPEEGHGNFMVVLPPGATATLTFPVTEEMVGMWEMGCFEQEGVHYDAGMKGPLTITQ